MIHGRDRAAVREQVQRIARECDLLTVGRAILFSARCFKQRGASYRRPATSAAREAHG